MDNSYCLRNKVSNQNVLAITLCDKVCHCLAAGRWFSPGTSASSTTKTGHHDIAELLLKGALSTINQIKSNLFLRGYSLVGR